MSSEVRQPEPAETGDQGSASGLTEMTDSMREVMSLKGDPGKLRDYYDNWAADYDADVADHGYGLPASMTATLADSVERWRAGPSLPSGVDRLDLDSVILDAGCGTGLVGAALAEAGYRNISGVDLSAEMVELARQRGIYQRLEAGVDLTVDPPGHLAASADIVTIGGVFTVGHVPPSALENVARMVRPGGILVVSTRPAYQAESGYDDVSAGLVGSGMLSLLVHNEGYPYTMDSTGDFWGYRVLD